MIEIPKSFWKYYDLYRREIITLKEFSSSSGLPEKELLKYLELLDKESGTKA